MPGSGFLQGQSLLLTNAFVWQCDLPSGCWSWKLHLTLHLHVAKEGLPVTALSVCLLHVTSSKSRVLMCFHDLPGNHWHECIMLHLLAMIDVSITTGILWSRNNSYLASPTCHMINSDVQIWDSRWLWSRAHASPEQNERTDLASYRWDLSAIVQKPCSIADVIDVSICQILSIPFSVAKTLQWLKSSSSNAKQRWLPPSVCCTLQNNNSLQTKLSWASVIKCVPLVMKPTHNGICRLWSKERGRPLPDLFAALDKHQNLRLLDLSEVDCFLNGAFWEPLALALLEQLETL